MAARQYGFDFDPGRCVQCHACGVACKTLHHVEWGVKWRRVVDVWTGPFPMVTSRGISFACLHCGNPPCAEVCPRGAISKRPEMGWWWWIERNVSVVISASRRAPLACPSSAAMERCKSAICAWNWQLKERSRPVWRPAAPLKPFVSAHWKSCPNGQPDGQHKRWPKRAIRLVETGVNLPARRYCSFLLTSS
jgi:formate hydrogenlyase subunit 6/NADH:ubiquinone oxidoreductase subunit I